jgi:hypothetical protein
VPELSPPVLQLQFCAPHFASELREKKHKKLATTELPLKKITVFLEKMLIPLENPRQQECAARKPSG